MKRNSADMKTKLIAIALVAGVAFLCADTAAAKDKKEKKKTMYPALLTTSDVKGANVINLQNEKIGDIDDLLIEADTGHIRFATVSVGGFLGIGSTRVAVPWGAFVITKENNKAKFVLDATKERLEKAPKVEGTNYDRLYTKADAEPVFIYWHEEWVAPAP
jgi:sporulation protein YlmC with PRC-barrel domain